MARAFMSIGEVLAALKAEFPDISVSKIRFLEAEGLIEPERTPSGYRKFVDADVERLRTVLRLQRDAFLPLKVIRERLAAGDFSIPAPGAQAPVGPPVAPPGAEAAPVEQPVARASDLDDDLRDASTTPVRLTEHDLAGETGLELGQVRSLREFGVLCEHRQNGSSYFDEDDVAVAQIARDLLKLGIEPRHMKQLRRFAEQEADLFGQLVTPAIRNRRPEAREQAVETLTELTKLARRLRTTYIMRSLRTLLHGDR